jgi:hypothetical protein
VNRRAGPGFSLIGLLVTLVCLLVLGVVMTNALNRAMTGSGSTLPGTAASFEDKQYLTALFKAMAADSHFNDGRFLVPGELSRRPNVSDNTTANLFSAMIAQHYTVPGQLISGNENSPRVWPDEDYDYAAYHPTAGTFWDPSFVADLEVESNDSFAHMPLFGTRLRQHWRFAAGSHTPLLGNRGPQGGIEDPSSFTYGRDGRWAGHIVFGDGHVEFAQSFTRPGLLQGPGGERLPDNIFDMEEGADGRDAILTFTKEMTEDGPSVQHD